MTRAAGLMMTCALTFAVGVKADVKLASLFTEGAVLQRQVAIPVWGVADAGEEVTVAFRGHRAAATADATGRWLVRLPAMEAGDAAELVVRGKNEIRLRDVVLGEVWLCSGQSNMAFRVEELEAPEEVAAAEWPGIRHFGVKANAAMEPVANATGLWVKASPATVGKFTATGYYFARELHRTLGVPVGLINASVGGTQIESWMSGEALASDPAFAVVRTRWQEVLKNHARDQAAYEAKLAAWKKLSPEALYAAARRDERAPTLPRGPGHRDTPASLFNGMIHPLAPYAVRGVLWDQGGANAARSGEYGALFKALITDWRARWGVKELSFYFVQDANNHVPDSTENHRAALRLAQAEALALPATGMVVQIDIGEANNVHPRNKWEVGRRLALIARAKTYGEAVPFSGPRLRETETTREGEVVTLTFAGQSGALMSRAATLRGFELSGADGKFVAARAEIFGADTVKVSGPGVVPVAVRYAWGDDPTGDLTDAAGRPAAPFVKEIK